MQKKKKNLLYAVEGNKWSQQKQRVGIPRYDKWSQQKHSSLKNMQYSLKEMVKYYVIFSLQLANPILHRFTNNIRHYLIQFLIFFTRPAKPASHNIFALSPDQYRTLGLNFI